MQHRRALELVLDHLRPQPVAVAGALHDGATGRRLSAHEERDADDAFVADHGDLGRRAVLHHVEKRDDRGRREVDVTERRSGFVDDLPQGHLDALELGQPSLPFA